MRINDIISHLESIAPPAYQETYDNAGLITGAADWECKGILTCLDATEEVIGEATRKGCNLVVAHHPIVFTGLKKITGRNYVERAVIKAIKNDIAIYAIHTNLDNVLQGVNDRMADKLDLVNRRILLPKENNLLKLYTFAPLDAADQVREAVFKAGGGRIGNYYNCSYNIRGEGRFTPGKGSDPTIGEIGKEEVTEEVKIEIIFPAYRKRSVIDAMIKAHPYEEVAYDIVPLSNYFQDVGSGLIGELETPQEETFFLEKLKNQFNLRLVKHTPLLNKPVKRVALCGGAGSFLVSHALAAGADAFITADMKYHEFFDADGRMLIADIGHYESEQFTIDLLYDILQEKFPTFAVLKTEVSTNPVRYYPG
ncbi:MAG TPA: Nif3-like dinuclear metal center hexameric protein [Chitinophagaceae bacterium]|nr:Nif3-like dinuclear metal center hexameric protein [Chitinophagaceae bacterium]